MANNDSSKICQADDNACKRDAQALCFHCSKNLCRIHLLQHSQLIEEKTRVEMNLLADRFNELSSRFEHISISSKILEKPFGELEKWAVEAHKKIDQIVENKRREVNDIIENYRIIFGMKNDEQIKKISESKKLIAELIQEADVSRKQMNDLQASINEAEKCLDSLDTHTIKIISPSPICYVNIEAQFFDRQSMSSDELRQFTITYIRLNGNIRNYYVKTKKDGLMSDLKNSFVRQYNSLETLTRIELSSNNTIDHQPKLDFILSVKVSDHRARKQYDENTNLASIFDNDIIVFYETPYALDGNTSSQILMPCRFQRILTKLSFGFPIYLSIPRHGCKGQDVLNALQDAFRKYFLLNPNNHRNLYTATLISLVNGQSQQTRKVLTDILKDPMNFNNTSVSLEVDIDNEIADMYENTQFKYGNLQ